MNETAPKALERPQQAGTGASVINTLIGIWLIISPFALVSFSNLLNARWNNVIVGILVGLFGIMRASGDTRACWSWSNVVLGVWLIISPFVLGFSNMVIPLWHNIIAGIVVALLGWARAFMPNPKYAVEHHA